jgi:hypothetical protein
LEVKIKGNPYTGSRKGGLEVLFNSNLRILQFLLTVLCGPF